MTEHLCIELELEDDRSAELRLEATRLGISEQEVFERALAVWLLDTADARASYSREHVGAEKAASG